MKDKKDKTMKTSTTVALVVGTVAVVGITAYAFTAKAAKPKTPKVPKQPGRTKMPTNPQVAVTPTQTPVNKLPRAGKPPREATHPSGHAPAVPTVEDAAADPVVRRPVMPDPREASWSELEDTVALLSPDAQWRFAVPEERAGVFPEGERVMLRMDTVDGMVTAEVTATSVGFNLISRLGPSVSYNRESGILQIYAGGYVGRIEIDAGGVSLSAWVLTDKAQETLGRDRRSRHLVDERIDGVWQVHAFLVDGAGSAAAHEFGEFLDQASALLWGDHWLEGQMEAA